MSEANTDQKRELLPDIERHHDRMKERMKGISNIIYAFEGEWSIAEKETKGPDDPNDPTKLEPRIASTIDRIYARMAEGEEVLDRLINRLGSIREMYLGNK